MRHPELILQGLLSGSRNTPLDTAFCIVAVKQQANPDPDAICSKLILPRHFPIWHIYSCFYILEQNWSKIEIYIQRYCHFHFQRKEKKHTPSYVTERYLGSSYIGDTDRRSLGMLQVQQWGHACPPKPHQSFQQQLLLLLQGPKDFSPLGQLCLLHYAHFRKGTQNIQKEDQKVTQFWPKRGPKQTNINLNRNF